MNTKLIDFFDKDTRNKIMNVLSNHDKYQMMDKEQLENYANDLTMKTLLDLWRCLELTFPQVNDGTEFYAERISNYTNWGDGGVIHGKIHTFTYPSVIPLFTINYVLVVEFTIGYSSLSDCVESNSRSPQVFISHSKDVFKSRDNCLRSFQNNVKMNAKNYMGSSKHTERLYT